MPALNTSFELTYLAKPKKLVTDYTRTICYETVTIPFIVGDKVIITSGTITYPGGGTTYTVGQILTIITGNLTITFNGSNKGCLLGNYLEEILECELAEYTHEEIARMAVSIYLDELKLKLVPKTTK